MSGGGTTHGKHNKRTVEEDLDDVEKVIEQAGCSRTYYALEACLGENDRDWRKCQEEVKAFKLCHERSKG
ncbi:hypothetical protein HKI87_03g25490 [Chloropicon roscoffensis]|uniref:CHCH domain-containing protein n=1 Tax=Chloropicon roscoffensis TaxID=1461544 RepID=A0AAX4P3R2_9CHLO